ncbi:hypothetical protein C408_4224 [Vibrio diabolicus E0666]|nr:hypothetical protein C408_4224 [Vibrio diabolicus E0666]
MVLEWSSDFDSKTLAMRAEYYIKQLTKAKKELLVTSKASIVVDENQQMTLEMALSK